MTDLTKLTRSELAERYNSINSTNLKPSSYTKKIWVEKLTVADPDACPLCGGDPANQTAAGQEGTFLGDSANTCPDCGKTYNLFTGELINIPEGTKTKRRRILNPQVKIDAKVEACQEIGVEIFYNKPDRQWIFANLKSGKPIFGLTSKQFAEYTTTELVEYTKTRKST